MTDLRPGDTVPRRPAGQLATLAPTGMTAAERAEFAAAAALAGGSPDRSGDVYYDRLCTRLETRLLTSGDRLPEADVWWRYRMAKRMAQPAQVDDPDKIRQFAADYRQAVADEQERRAR